MRSLWNSVVACAVCLTACAGWAGADGKSYRTTDSRRYLPTQQHEQLAAIAHSQGVERLVIAVNMTLDEKESGLWVLPVQGTPRQVKLDLVDAFPEFRGRSVYEHAKSLIGGIMTGVRVTQVWPVLFELSAPLSRGRRSPLAVHEEVDRWGLHTETVTANSPEDLAEYLGEKGVSLPEAELAAFVPYMSGQHVLVLCWIASLDEVLRSFPDAQRGDTGRWPCLFVEFPTDRPFYPMKATASYGDAPMELTVFLVGYVRPQSGGPLPDMSVGHFLWERPREQARHPFWQGLSPEGFTRVHFSGKANQFSDDIWFAAAKPLRIAYARAVNSLSVPWRGLLALAAVTALLSYVAAGFASLVVSGKWQAFAHLGLWNLLTLFAVVVAFRRAMKRDPARGTMPEGCLRVGFPETFSVFFVLLTILAQFLLNLPLFES